MRFFLLLMMSVGMVLARETRTDAYTQAQFQTALKQAERGDVDAQIRVAFCYHDGSGVKEDRAESLKWMEKAADQGLSDAQFLVGLSYYVGMDVKIDDKRGIEWFEKAAKQGEPAALHYLGAAYYLGKGVQQDYLESYKWSLVFRDSGRVQIPDDTDSLDAEIKDVEQKLTPEQIKAGKEMANKLKNELSKFPRYYATD